MTQPTSREAYQDQRDSGSLEALRKRALRCFARGPRTTWAAAKMLSPQNPHAIEKDLTAAVTWLRHNRLVEPTGQRGPSRSGEERAQVLRVADLERANAWVEGRIQIDDPPSGPVILRRVAEAAQAHLDAGFEWSDRWVKTRHALEKALKDAKERGLL